MTQNEVDRLSREISFLKQKITRLEDALGYVTHDLNELQEHLFNETDNLWKYLEDQRSQKVNT